MSLKNAVFIISILTGFVLIVGPFFPEIYLPVKKIVSPVKTLKGEHVSNVEYNKIIIPKIEVNSKIYESDLENLDNVLLNGPTRKYNSSDPVTGGNTVIVAHRIDAITGPNTFYHLPKLAKDDEIQIVWDKNIYNYKVYETFEVDPSDLSVEENTFDSILTLYTCAPLIDFSKRFVVRAKLDTTLNY